LAALVGLFLISVSVILSEEVEGIFDEVDACDLEKKD
jgi:Flp pilus assembly pilin Flp